LGEEIKNIDHFKTGFFTFHNEFLYQKQDPTFWNEVDRVRKLDSTKKVDLDCLDYISSTMAEKTFVTLFGLDFLIDNESNIYYLLEVNYFPSYRELGTKLRDNFEEHIINLNYKNKIK
jgi:hypothetical protein